MPLESRVRQKSHRFMKIDNKIIDEIKNKAKEFFVGADGCHDWSHVERVYNITKISPPLRGRGKSGKKNVNVVN
jgi:hypothetical protein